MENHWHHLWGTSPKRIMIVILKKKVSSSLKRKNHLPKAFWGVPSVNFQGCNPINLWCYHSPREDIPNHLVPGQRSHHRLCTRKRPKGGKGRREGVVVCLLEGLNLCDFRGFLSFCRGSVWKKHHLWIEWGAFSSHWVLTTKPIFLWMFRGYLYMNLANPWEKRGC